MPSLPESRGSSRGWASTCNYSERSRERHLALPFGYQTIEAMISRPLEFSQESLAGRELKSGASQRRKWFHTVVIIHQDHLSGKSRLDNTGLVTCRNFHQNCTDKYPHLLLNPKPHVGSSKVDWPLIGSPQCSQLNKPHFFTFHYYLSL